jgi:hypothetical protein
VGLFLYLGLRRPERQLQAVIDMLGEKKAATKRTATVEKRA